MAEPSWNPAGTPEVAGLDSVESLSDGILSSALDTRLSLEARLQLMLDAVLETLGAETGSILLVAADTRMYVAAARGLSSEVVNNTCLELGESISGYVLRSGEGLLVRNIEQDDRFRRRNLERYYTRSFVSAPLVTFAARAAFTFLKPTGEFMGIKGCPEQRSAHAPRPVATILSGGGIPPEMREYCDLGSIWLKEMASSLCNGECIGEVYAGAIFTKELEGDEWHQAFLYRELTEGQLQEACDVGKKMVQALKAGHVKLRIYDERGRLVRTLVDGPQSAGPQEVVWNATDDAGKRVASGVYHYVMQSGTTELRRKMVVIK